MKKSISITLIVLRLFLGGVMIAGGIGKFLKPLPSPTEKLQKAESYTSPNDTQTLQKIVFPGSKFFWLALASIVAGGLQERYVRITLDSSGLLWLPPLKGL